MAVASVLVDMDVFGWKRVSLLQINVPTSRYFSYDT